MFIYSYTYLNSIGAYKLLLIAVLCKMFFISFKFMNVQLLFFELYVFLNNIFSKRCIIPFILNEYLYSYFELKNISRSFQGNHSKFLCFTITE